MTRVYQQLDESFKNINVFAIMKDGQWLGRLLVKKPSRGFTTYVYAELFGAPMQCGIGGIGPRNIHKIAIGKAFELLKGQTVQPPYSQQLYDDLVNAVLAAPPHISFMESATQAGFDILILV